MDLGQIDANTLRHLPALQAPESHTGQQRSRQAMKAARSIERGELQLPTYEWAADRYPVDAATLAAMMIDGILPRPCHPGGAGHRRPKQQARAGSARGLHREHARGALAAERSGLSKSASLPTKPSPWTLMLRRRFGSFHVDML